MADDRQTVLERIFGFVQRDPPVATRILVVNAPHATGLTSVLREVAARTPDGAPVVVLDDVQRAVAAREKWLRDGRIRMVIGVDVDDAADLGVNVTRAVKKLVDQGVVQAQKTRLPAVPDQAIAEAVLGRWPSTAPKVAAAVARRVDGRIGLLADMLALPDVLQRVRDDRVCMVPGQIEQLAVGAETLLEAPWRSLDGASRRTVLAICRLGPVPLDRLLAFLGRAGIDRAARPRLATLKRWIDVRDGTVLPGKGVKSLAAALSARHAPVAVEVAALVERFAASPEAATTTSEPGASAGAAPEQPAIAPRSRAPRQAPSPPEPSRRARRRPPAPPKPRRRARGQGNAAAQPPARPVPPTPQSEAAPRPRPSPVLQRELFRFHGEAAWHASEAIEVRRELIASLRVEGRLHDAARQQQAFVDHRAEYLGAKHPEVAEELLELAEMLAELGERSAHGVFRDAIARLTDAFGQGSSEARDARRRRSKALRR